MGEAGLNPCRAERLIVMSRHKPTRGPEEVFEEALGVEPV